MVEPFQVSIQSLGAGAYSPLKIMVRILKPIKLIIAAVKYRFAITPNIFVILLAVKRRVDVYEIDEFVRHCPRDGKIVAAKNRIGFWLYLFKIGIIHPCVLPWAFGAK